MSSVELAHEMIEGWMYSSPGEWLGDGIVRTATLVGRQSLADDAEEVETDSAEAVTLLVLKSGEHDSAQDVLVLSLSDDATLDYDGGEAKVLIVADQGLAVQATVLDELGPARPVFPMSTQLIAMFSAVQDIVVLYRLSDGVRRMGEFKTQAPLVWDLEPLDTLRPDDMEAAD